MEEDSSGYLKLSIRHNTVYDNAVTDPENDVTTQRYQDTFIGDKTGSDEKEESIYHRIHQYDSDRGFEVSRAYLDRTRPLPSIPTQQDGRWKDALGQNTPGQRLALSRQKSLRLRLRDALRHSTPRQRWVLPRQNSSRCRLAAILSLLILVVCGALVGLIKISCFQAWLCDSSSSDSSETHGPSQGLEDDMPEHSSSTNTVSTTDSTNLPSSSTTIVSTTDSTNLPSSTTIVSMTGPPQEESCDLVIRSNYGESVIANCTVTLRNAQIMSVEIENADEVIYNFQDDNLNITLRGICIHMERSLKEVIVTSMQEANCSTEGIHQASLSNATHTRTISINVTINPDSLLCPCSRNTQIGRKGYIQCSSIPSANVSITFRGSNPSMVLLPKTSVGDIPGYAPLSLEGAWINVSISRTEALVRISFPIVKCIHEGKYVITIGNISYETVLFVKDFPDTPTIGARYDDLGGLVEGHTGEIICQARVGCGPVPTMFEKVFGEYQELAYSKVSSERNDLGRTYNVTLTIDEIHMASVNGSTYVCSYVDNGVTYQSKEFVALVISSDYCRDRQNCYKQHPYACNKFIACEPTRPKERLCDPNLHFFFPESDVCHGQCGTKWEANCQIGN